LPCSEIPDTEGIKNAAVQVYGCPHCESAKGKPGVASRTSSRATPPGKAEHS